MLGKKQLETISPVDKFIVFSFAAAFQVVLQSHHVSTYLLFLVSMSPLFSHIRSDIRVQRNLE